MLVLVNKMATVLEGCTAEAMDKCINVGGGYVEK
jgi:hypothetical protein